MTLEKSKHYNVLSDMIGQVSKRSFHKYARQYVHYPPINTFQLHLTYLFLSTIDKSDYVRETYCMSLLYIQLSLDTHATVRTEELIDPEKVKERQLTILSGDYFSSHYYLFLAERNELNLIKKWSDVIKEMNEQKTILHEQGENLSLTHRQAVRSFLNRRLSEVILEWFDAPRYWYNVNDLFCNLPMSETDCHDSMESFEMKWRSVRQHVPNEDILSELDNWWETWSEKWLTVEPK